MSDTLNHNTDASGGAPPVLPQAVQMPSASIGRRWALLIGIDDYPIRSLSGCVADVSSMESVLHSHYEFHKIEKLVAPIKTASNSKTEPAAMPTRAGIIAAIDAIGEQSKPGDFVYIHYSGHGAQLKTVYEKKGSKIDEALVCFGGTYIRDIEMSVLLDRLAAKELTVAVTLDCCHSGGALRGEDGKKIPEGWRNRSLDVRDSDVGHEEWLGRVPDRLQEQEERNSWFYGEKDYHLLAACQPREYALERPGPSRGLFTSYLVQAFENLGNELQSVSYGTVIGEVRALCMDNSGEEQCPVLFGNRIRTFLGFFGVQNVDPFQDSAFVIRLGGDSSVVLSSGSTDLVSEGDKYGVYQRDGTNTKVLVCVTQVGAYLSEASVSEGDTSKVRPGFRVKLLKRAAPAQVILLETESRGSEFLEVLSAQCAAFFDVMNPLKFRVGTINADADFYVRVNKELHVEILGKDKTLLPHIPTETADGTPLAAQTLCTILQHVRAYLAIANMAPSTTLNPPPTMELTTSREGILGNEIATCSIDFTNSSPFPVWITALNLAPDWSISKLIWSTGSGQEVEARDSIETFTVGITVPGVVRSSNVRSMTERVRLFVSRERHDFSNLTLAPLGLARRGGYRNMVPRPMVKKWAVCDTTFEVSW